MNEGVFNQPAPSVGSPRSEGRRREAPKPLSHSRPVGERLAGVLRGLMGGPAHHERELEEVDLLHPDVSIGPAVERTGGSAGGDVASHEKGSSDALAPKDRARSVVRNIVRGTAPAPAEMKSAPADREGQVEPSADAKTPEDEESKTESTEREAEGEIADEDRKVVKIGIRMLQEKNECPDAFPLNQADLDRLALGVHGMPANDNARQIVREGLEEIAAKRAA